MLQLTAGILVVVAGVVWAHCLGDAAKDRVMDVMAPVLAGCALPVFSSQGRRAAERLRAKPALLTVHSTLPIAMVTLHPLQPICADWRACSRWSWTGSSLHGTGRAPSLRVRIICGCHNLWAAMRGAAQGQHMYACWAAGGDQSTASRPHHATWCACIRHQGLPCATIATPRAQPPFSLLSTAGATQRSAAEAAYFEPLAEIDPEDHRSPPLFPGR